MHSGSSAGANTRHPGLLDRKDAGAFCLAGAHSCHPKPRGRMCTRVRGRATHRPAIDGHGAAPHVGELEDTPRTERDVCLLAGECQVGAGLAGQVDVD